LAPSTNTSWFGSRLSRIREPEKSKARSNVDNAVTLWFEVRMSAFLARPIRFSGVRAVDVEETEYTRVANAAKACDINMVAAEHSVEEALAGCRSIYRNGVASDMWWVA